ncbi:MAG: TIGR03435 family protein [Ignavibacteriota bacterium]
MTQQRKNGAHRNSPRRTFRNARTFAAIAALIAAPSFAQEPKFELADVHTSATAQGFVQNFGGVLRGGRYVNRDATMIDLIKAAYGVSEDEIAGGPGWLSSEVYDVVAKVPDGTTLASANLMLKALLEDRFKLVVRHDSKPVPRYVLTVGKGGPKLKAASGSGTPNCQPKGGPSGPGNPADPASMPNIVVSCQNLTADAIAENLRQMAGGYLDHDVVNSTKLEGSWDFELEWTPRAVLAAKGAEGISVFDAVDKQLGLKLEQQNIPMPALVVASVNRKPTENPEGAAKALALEPARFEAASIKPASPDNQMTGLLYTGGSQMRAGGTLREMIAMSLQISPNIAADTVLGLPKFAESTRWEIIAKVPATGEGAPNVVRGRPQPPPLSIGLEMLHGLLLDRFELKYHKENREVTVYALVVGSGKPKLTQAEESERTGCRPDANAPKPVPNMGPMIGCKNTTMAELAQTLARNANAYIDHPIVDATGLQGGWNFAIGWTPRGMIQAAASPSPNQPAGALAAASDPNGITVFEAVERELGLKLVKQTRSIPVIVVDHLDEKPVE